MSPAAVTFGNVPVGSTSNQSLTITNSGSSPVTISQASATGTGFSVAGASLPLTLSPGNSFTLTATFAPTTTGNASGSISIASAQLSSPVAIQTTGVGMAVSPTITVQPVSQSVVVGQTANFFVSASGTAPLNYQWWKNGAAISAATSSSYTTPAESSSDNGAQFSVVVSNSAGNVTSSVATLTVTAATVAPSITAQPTNQTTFVGQTATFSVTATGTAPLSYQWQKNGAAISGAISSTYATPAATISDSGAQFAVVVHNSAGNVISNAATLTVNPDPAPAITAQPASQTITAGQTATFSVTATGTPPLGYQWQKNGTAISGAISSTYTTPATTASDNGAQFAVVVSNSAGSATSNAAILTVNSPPAVITQPVNQTVAAGQAATFSVTATGTAPLNYQWKKNGANISGATASAYTTPATTASDSGAQFTVMISNIAGTTTSNAATLTVNPAPVAPSITTQPTGQTVTAGQTATFSVTATGTAPLSYQWQKNGTAISGATSSIYVTPATTSSDNGALFTVVVSNSAGSVTSNTATLTVNPAPVAPSITTQPTGQTVTAGRTATFSVTATGTVPLSYQWQKNATAISGATSSSYTTPATTSSDNGALFTVVVTNSAGTVTSNAATLTVNVIPSVTTQPASQTVTAGQTATFSVTATGTAPLNYQWQKNGTAISGATSSSYTTPTTTSSDNGALFTVVVTNSAGSVTSSAATLTVNPAPVAPSITTQPASQTVTAGQTATFSVTASGTAPLSYQWQKNGTAISGATSSSYTTSATTSSDNGAQFTVVVSNSAGSVTSNAATLTVNMPPSITTQPASQTVTAGQTATFSVTATGTAPLSYQWQKNGTAISGATSSSYTTSATTSSDTGALFTVAVTNSVGSVTSNAATLTVNVPPSITTQPASQTVNAGQTATFSVTASGTAPLTYQWRKNGTAISGATSVGYTTPATTSSDSGALFTVVVTNTVGSVTSNAATLSVNPAPVAPSITTQPVSQTVTAGQTATFSVTATGTAPLSYQWQKNGTAVSGATTSSYTTPATTSSDNGALFTVILTNSAGSVTSNAAALTVNPAPVAPSITTQPASQTVTAGQTATFSVTATGTAPLSYQWQKNGAAISGATSSSYTTPATTSSDNGALFTVVVTNSAGSVTSSVATLTVNPAPVAPSITTQPTSQTVTAGQTATFSVTATGTAPLSYQWQKNGTAVSGATTLSYTTPATTSSDNGALFTVAVTNSVGSVTSSAATLTVNVPPSITTQPVTQTVTAGQTATFSVTATGTAPLSYQWQKNGTAVSGATTSSYTTPATTSSDNGALFTVVVSNSVGSVTSNAATLTVNPAPVAPAITTQPGSQTVTAGQTATFSVTATGTAPLSYQWQKNGTAISGATSSSYTTPATTSSDNGAQFTVVVSNSVGSATSNAATLSVNVPPSITTQPASQTVTAGQTATFSVTATGTAPLSYQWQKNSTAISGATSSSYTTPATTSSDNGALFTVVVTNSVGSVTSNAATLNVNVPPSITTQPASQTVTAGQTATFSVTANGTAPLTYQWRKNGTAISGATSSTYTTPATTSSDNGAQFTALVTNSVGSVTSSAATLTVTTPGQLSSTASSLTFGNVNVGSSGTQSVTLTNSGGSNVSISNVTISGAGFSVNGISTGLILSPGASVTMNVTFAPAAFGSVTGSVTITSTASNSPLTISLSGTGIVVTHSATLSWTASTSIVVGYNVYRKSTSGGPYTRLNSSVNVPTTYIDSAVLSGQTYYYVVTAVDSNNVESVYSNQVTAVIP